jgi:putative spermidine/putrescine transport system permease protein
MNRSHWFYRAWSGLLLGLMAFFILNIGLMVASVAFNSLARRWLGTWLPEGYTTNWYVAAWKEFQLGDILWVTVEVVFAVVALSILLGVPAAYALARREFAGKRLVMLLFVLPLIIPPITYGIPLATVMYQAHLGGTIYGVILANLVPALPFVILVMTPFIEQVDPTLESAARVFGAGTLRIFWHVLAPLLLPGILAAALLPHSRSGLSDAGGRSLLCGVRRRRPRAAIGRCDGDRLHGDHAGLAPDRAALRQSDPAGQPREGTAGALTQFLIEARFARTSG